MSDAPFVLLLALLVCHSSSIGSAAADRLLQNGEEVIGIDRSLDTRS
jgi:nucleoside-diphosphate-sugar epimerase